MIRIIENRCLICKHYIMVEHECEKGNYINDINFCENVVAHCDDYEPKEKEGGLRKLGVHKVEISGMPTFNHMCHDCWKDFERYLGKKKEGFNESKVKREEKPTCMTKDEAICEEMTPNGHCNYLGHCPNKEEGNE